MKERIIRMIAVLKAGKYDEEIIHQEYDRLLEDVIKSMGQLDEQTLNLMQECIDLPKDFWYA